MKKVLYTLRYLLLVVILCVLTYAVSRVEKISSVQSFLYRIRGILSTNITSLAIILVLVVITVGGIVYVRLHDKENNNKKNL